MIWLLARSGRFVRGVVVGAAVAYFFDPEEGHARRVKARDQALSTARRMEHVIRQQAVDRANRMQGWIHDATSTPAPPADERMLEDRIRSTVMRHQHARAGAAAGPVPFGDLPVNLEVRGGVVVIRGQVPDEATRYALEHAIRAVPGVVDVVAETHLPGQPPPNKVEAMDATR